MKVLSLFDGISCARVALERLGIKIDKYYASEVDKYAIQIAQKNFPDTIQVGDITKLHYDYKTKYLIMNNSVLIATPDEIDLMIGGSPCQDLSIAKKNRQGLKGERSGLFFEYVRLLKEVKPKYFILENVASMPKEAKEQISEMLGVEPIMINASLVSAQNRKRLFWTNIKGITQPEDRGIFLKDILQNGETEDLKSYAIDANYYKGFNSGSQGGVSSLYKGKRQSIRIGQLKDGRQWDRVYNPEGKSVTLNGNGGGGGANTGLYLVVPEATKKGFAIANDGDSVDFSFPTSKTRRGRVGNKAKNIMTTQNIGVFTKGTIRKLTPIECERLQSLSDNYTEGVSNTQRYRALGNAFNVEVIKHILSFIEYLEKS